MFHPQIFIKKDSDINEEIEKLPTVTAALSERRIYCYTILHHMGSLG